MDGSEFAGQYNASGTSVDFPSFTTSTSGPELYVGYALLVGSYAAGGTTGFTFEATVEDDLFCYGFTGPSYTDSVVTLGDTYYYTVAAITGIGTGPESTEASGTATSGTLPGIPTLSVTNGASLVLNWSTPSAGTDSITNYKVYKGSTSGGETLLTTLGVVNTYTDSAVTSGDTYYYKVAAVSGIGTGTESTEASGLAGASSWPYTGAGSPDPIGTSPSPFVTSIFTTPVPASPTLASNSAAQVTEFLAQIASANNEVGVNFNSSCATRYVVHGNSMTWTNMSVIGYDGTPIGTIPVPIPSFATPDPNGSDRQMIIIDVDNLLVWEFWSTFAPGQSNEYQSTVSVWTCWTFEVGPLGQDFYGVWPGYYPSGSSGGWPGNGSPPAVAGDAPSLSWSASASHISYAGGIITMADLVSGSIEHAINMALPTPGGPVSPATASDGGGAGCPEGSWFYFPASVSMPGGLSPIAQMIFTAIKKYGLYIMDTSGSVNAYCENADAWTNYSTYPTGPGPWTYFNSNGANAYTELTALPWSELVLLAPATQAAIVGGAS